MLLTYSFDIFDTCLVRKCGSSDNIFVYGLIVRWGRLIDLI